MKKEKGASKVSKFSVTQFITLFLFAITDITTKRWNNLSILGGVVSAFCGTELDIIRATYSTRFASAILFTILTTDISKPTSSYGWSMFLVLLYTRYYILLHRATDSHWSAKSWSKKYIGIQLPINVLTLKRKWRWIGHILRKANNSIAMQ